MQSILKTWGVGVRMWQRILRTLRKLFGEHERLISSVSLFLILGTFVSKEYLPDEYKDEAAAIDIEQPISAMREDLEETNEKIIDLRRRLSLTMPMLREDDPMQSILAPIDTADKEISRIWFVVDALPDNDELERQVRTLHNRSDDLRSQILPVEGDPRHVQLPAGIYEGVMELQKQVDGLGQTVWPLADSEYDKAKHRFRVFTLVSYFTYGLGWLLTFVRGLFGAAKPALGE